MDDEPGILEQAKNFIEKENEKLEVETTASPKKALDMLESGDYDAVVSDYQMPEKDGLELLEILRKEKQNNIPFIIFTGKGREKVAMEALNLGADRYLQKGGDPRAQYSVLANAIFQEVENWNRRTDLEKSRKETEILLDNFPAMFFITEGDDRIVKVNRTMADFLGVSKGEIEGKSLDEVFPEEQAKEMKEDNEKVMSSEEPKLGKIESYKTQDGTRWTRTDKLPMEDENGQTTGVICFARDITERKRTQEREEFLHSLLRHDVGNKIRIIEGYLELLEDFDLADEARDYVSKVEKEAKEAGEIIERIRNLRKVREEDVRKIGIGGAVREAVEQIESLARERGMEIEADLPEEGLKVMGGSLLNQIFSNIIENAVQHSGGNKIQIRVETTEEETICVVEDDGEGIPDEEKSKIFEKGYTTDAGGGTGLGLFLVKMLLETYGGSIEVKDSELGGARFDVHMKKS